MSEPQSGSGLGSASALGSGFPLGPILGGTGMRQGESNPMYYNQNTHAFYAGHHAQPGTPPQRGQPGDSAYVNGHLVPYLNQHASGDAGELGAGASQLDAFYIQQSANSFGMPLDVGDVGAYGHPGSGLPLRGAPNMQGWAAPSRQSPAVAPQEGTQEEQDMLHSHGYAPAMSGRAVPGALYARHDAQRQMMMEQDAAARAARGAPLPKRRRTSPVPFGDNSADFLSRFRGQAQGAPGARHIVRPGMPGRRDMDGGEGLADLLPHAEEGASSDFTWILGPEDAQHRAAQPFGIADAAAYYRHGAMGHPGHGIRLDMPGMPVGHHSMDPSKGMAPLRSHAPNSDDEPLYVNAKQYQRILKRRAARSRMEEKRRQLWMLAVKQREEQKTGGATDINAEWVSGILSLDEDAKKPYLHESRHKHAMRRPRGPGGRFLTTEEIKKRDETAAKEALADAPSGASPAPTQ